MGRDRELERLMRVFGENPDDDRRETGFSRISLRPIEIGSKAMTAVATGGMSLLYKKLGIDF